jgi:ABC-type antimicrobial peptide transport system permease subunit
VVLACGAAAGVPLALWAAHFVERQLFAVTSRDPIAIAGAVTALFVVAAIAAMIPANRASRIDPVRALRSD